ncbi:MAG: type I DNA topoisomerase [Desulfohalobiaceae bacterium]|nr:type I DNA topoisomerase [Desulfohalobiaceae bacterium]
MTKDLIIVESPAKVRTIKKFLGKGYTVEASVGHVRDLPSNSLGVDEENGFQPEYRTVPGKEKVVKRLRDAAAGAERVYLAPDPDREGEAIAWHVAELIQDVNDNFNRIQFNEITSRAVKAALEAPRQLDRNLFDSQQARRVLDRLVGYKLSPLLWKKVKRGISAGRVQSVALRLIVERERERENFVAQEYWLFKAKLEGKHPPPFEAELWRVDGKKPRIGDSDTAEKLHAEVAANPFLVEDIQEKERKKHPGPPFITSTLQQEASNKLGFSAKKTMTVAQQLYEGVELGDRGTTALITYMRTDSVRVSSQALQMARDWIQKRMGDKYLPQKPRQFKSKGNVQDAHEAIRPVDPGLSPDEVKSFLGRDQQRLYRLIWQRFIASQMSPATYWDTVVLVQAGRTKWRCRGQRLIFPGFLEVYSPEESLKEVRLPELGTGEELTVHNIEKEQKFTQPPARYSEASLVKTLEKKGIGRPSTYAQIISTLQDRDYVRTEKKQFVPTELGKVVSDLLVGHFTTLMDVGFTASMEDSLDRIAEGELDWVGVLNDFSKDFDPALESAQENMAQVKTGLDSGLTCEQCGRRMVIKFGKHGEFLACEGYPECQNSSNFTRDEQGNIQPVEEAPPEEMGSCPRCGKTLVLKKSRTGSRFIACTGYPDCRYTSPLGTGVACPVEGCSGELVEKSSKRGKVFYSCNQYPDCTYALWNPPVNEECPKCGHPLLEAKSTKSRGEHLACPLKGCSYRRSRDTEEGSG